MNELVGLSNKDALKHFLKGSSYFNNDFPSYISFEPILVEVAKILNGGTFDGHKLNNPKESSNVNYNFSANKDGKFAWRPLELIHPAIYVSLVNTICDSDNWNYIQKRFSEFENGVVECCSAPVISLDEQSDTAKQISIWWKKIEQQSIVNSLKFSHILHTDVTDCYGSLYTHSIPWAIHGKPESKKRKADKSLLGNKIDFLIQAGRYGQTNGISQGSVLMDFIAEIVLGYVDECINLSIEKDKDLRILKSHDDFHILRYRDDYRIFANSDEVIEKILKVISCELMDVGMRLELSKTFLNRNVVEGSIKPDKLAGIELLDLGESNAKTIQKQLLRLHSFGQRFPNSGALNKLVSDYHSKIYKMTERPDDLEVQVAIATDIVFVSPRTINAIAAILSRLISLASKEEKLKLWEKVRKKMARLPYNGYLEIWLQRVVQPKSVGLPFESDEKICKIVKGDILDLWDNGWIACQDLKDALEVSKIIEGSVYDADEVIQPEEIELFKQNAFVY